MFHLYQTFHYVIRLMWLTDTSFSKSFLCHHCVVLYTVYVSARHQCEAMQHVAPRCTLCNSRQRLLSRLPLPILTPLKLALLAQAPACSRLRFRCCCCCCCCRPAAVRTPYECRQNGWLHAEMQATISAAVESWQTGFNSLFVQHVRFFLGPTDVQAVVICLIWCRVVRSRNFRSRVFSVPFTLYVYTRFIVNAYEYKRFTIKHVII